MFHGNLEIGGPQLWPDDPDEELLKLLILSPRFRVGLLIWYVQDDQLWKALTDEMGGSFPIEWMLTSKPPGKDILDLRLGVIRKAIGGMSPPYSLREAEQYDREPNE